MRRRSYYFVLTTCHLLLTLTAYNLLGHLPSAAGGGVRAHLLRRPGNMCAHARARTRAHVHARARAHVHAQTVWTGPLAVLNVHVVSGE